MWKFGSGAALAEIAPNDIKPAATHAADAKIESFLNIPIYPFGLNNNYKLYRNAAKRAPTPKNSIDTLSMRIGYSWQNLDLRT